MGICLICGHDRLYVTAQAGLGQNVKCDRCGSLHLAVQEIGKWKLLRAGQPKPKVMMYGEFIQEFDSDQEALTYVKMHWKRGMYMVDSDGVVATDSLHHP